MNVPSFRENSYPVTAQNCPQTRELTTARKTSHERSNELAADESRALANPTCNGRSRNDLVQNTNRQILIRMMTVEELKHVTPLFLEAEIIGRCEGTGHNYVWVARTLWMSRVEQLESLTPTIPLYRTCGMPRGHDQHDKTRRVLARLDSGTES